MRPSADRILGALYGVAFGDAMGMPGEMWTRKQIASRFGKIETFQPGQADHPISAGFSAGETTDDTAMTFLVSKLIADFSCDPDPVVFMQRVEEWAEKTGKSGTVIGPSTRRAFDLIKSGTPVSEAGRMGTTNGGAMRISPAGIVVDYKDEGKLLELVEKLCMPTHYTSVAISAAAAVAASVSYALRNEAFDGILETAEYFSKLGSELGNDLCGPSVTERLNLACDISGKTPDDEEFLQKLYDIVGTGLPSNESVPAAMSIAFRCGKDVKRCAVLCANAGGDTDTMGAVACAISGAYAGLCGFEPGTADVLRSVNQFDFALTAGNLEKLIAD